MTFEQKSFVSSKTEYFRTSNTNVSLPITRINSRYQKKKYKHLFNSDLEVLASFSEDKYLPNPKEFY